MRNILNISKYKAVTVVFAFVLLSCEGFLDEQPLDSPGGNEFYSNETEVFMAVNAAYNYIDAGEGGNHMSYIGQLIQLSDNVYLRWGNFVQPFRQGGLNPLTSGIVDYYSDMYKGIAICNLGIEGMEAAREKMEASGDLALWNSYRSELRVIRAWLYYNLLNKYGDVPFTTTQLSTASEYASLGRTDEDEIYDFIFTEIEEAAPLLTPNGTAPGRITRNTAYAVGAKAAMFRAFFTNGQAITPDATYLARVRDWTQAIIDSGVNELYYSPSDVKNSYKELFLYPGENSKEVILQVEFNFGGGKSHSNPRIRASRNMPNAFGAIAPTTGLVHAYEDTLGNSVTNSALFDPKDPFIGRDPRLYQTVLLPRVEGDTPIDVVLNTAGGTTTLRGYNEVWPGSPYPDAFNDKLIRDYKTSLDQWVLPPEVIADGFANQAEYNLDDFHWWTDENGVDHTVGNSDATNQFASYTGLNTYKYMDFSDFPDNGNNSSLNQMIIRYADILLMNAEARIELNDDLAQAAEYMNMVRARGYGLTLGEYITKPSAINAGIGQAAMRIKIRRERKVELALEGWRWEDLKRYGSTVKALNPVMVGRPKFYHLQDPTWIPIVDDNAVVELPWLDSWNPADPMFPYRSRNGEVFKDNYESHFDLWPIPQGEFDNGNLTSADQNPGYVGG